MGHKFILRRVKFLSTLPFNIIRIELMRNNKKLIENNNNFKVTVLCKKGNNNHKSTYDRDTHTHECLIKGCLSNIYEFVIIVYETLVTSTYLRLCSTYIVLIV